MYEAREEGKGVVIEAFRGSTKTTTLTIAFTAFRIGKEPQKANLLIQVGDDTASDTTQQIADIIENNPETELADKIEDALYKTQTALEELTKSTPDRQAAVGNIEGAVGDLEATVKDDLLNINEGIQLMDKLTSIARELAIDAINEAIAQGGDSDKIEEAQEYLVDGDTLRANGLSGEYEDFKKAVNKYKDALSKAESAIS